MIGRCFRCGVWGEVDLSDLSGGSRILCASCAGGAGAPLGRVPTPARFRTLYESFRNDDLDEDSRQELVRCLTLVLDTARRRGDAERVRTAQGMLGEVSGVGGTSSRGRRSAARALAPSADLKGIG